MTIDEAIKEEQTLYDIAKDKYEKLGIKNCLKGMKEHKQYIEWLEELKAIKNDGFTDDLLNMGFTKGYNKALDDFVHKVKEHQYVLSDVINSKDYGMFTIGIEQIAEQLKAGETE